MNQNNTMFEKEKIGILLFKLSVPVMITILVSELYNMVDTIFVGNFVDANGIGALAVVFPVQRIIIALSMMIGVGSSTAFSRARGAKDMERAKKIIKNGFTLVLVVMIPITILILSFSQPILHMLGGGENLIHYAMEYLDVIILGSTFLSLTIFISNIMISLGKSHVSILSTSLGAVLNVIIDYILVKEMHMGVKGAAIATLVSQIASFLFAYYHLRKLKKEMGIAPGFEFKRHIIVAILMVGVSAFIVEAEDGILMAFLNNLLLDYAGDEAIIVLAVITKVYMFLFVTLFGISSGMQPIAAYNVGAKNYKRLLEVLKKTIFFATLATLIIWVISMIFTPQIMRVFVDDQHIIKESVVAFRIMISLFPLVSVYYISIFYFQSLGKAKHSILMSVLRQLGLMLPIAWILVKYFDMKAMGVWLSYPIADAIVMVIAIIMLSSEYKKIKVLAN